MTRRPFSVRKALFLTLVISLASAEVASAREHLRVRNSFQKPQEVVAYYCARDAEGMIWEGMLQAERKAFTLWTESPEQDSFYVARDYQISAPQIHGDRAFVEVRYDVVAISDAHGTRIPATDPVHKIVFELRKSGSAWKIASPDPRSISPVVLESKFTPPSR